jgi:hypothetical protein
MEAGENAAKTKAAANMQARAMKADVEMMVRAGSAEATPDTQAKAMEAGVDAAKARATASTECKPAEIGGTKIINGGDDDHLTGLELSKIEPETKTQRSYNKGKLSEPELARWRPMQTTMRAGGGGGLQKARSTQQVHREGDRR